MISEPVKDLKSNLFGEALIFGLLGRLIYAELDKAWLDTLIAEDVFSEAPFGDEQPDLIRGFEILRGWCAAHLNGISAEGLEALQADQLRLLIGLGSPLAPPWESVYFSQDKMLFQEQTLDVRNWYWRFGLEIERLNHEPDDHIGLELSFLAHLSQLSVQAFEQQDTGTLAQLLDDQKAFLSKHLLLWAPQWCELVKQHAQTDFYRGIAWVVSGALQAAAELCSDR
jgi:putative dimethyl sulfoxide reductase chaperone